MSKGKQITKVETSNADQFNAKKLGANLIATIGKERYAKKVTSEEGEKIMKKITLYNRKPSENLRKQIIFMLTPESAKVKAVKEQKEAAVKGLKQQAKKVEKAAKTVIKEEKTFLESLEDFINSEESPEVAVEKIDKILASFRKVEEKKPQPVAQQGRRFSGEH